MIDFLDVYCSNGRLIDEVSKRYELAPGDDARLDQNLRAWVVRQQIMLDLGVLGLGRVNNGGGILGSISTIYGWNWCMELMSTTCFLVFH